jgi:hypothetical protein
MCCGGALFIVNDGGTRAIVNKNAAAATRTTPPERSRRPVTAGGWPRHPFCFAGDAPAQPRTQAAVRSAAAAAAARLPGREATGALRRLETAGVNTRCRCRTVAGMDVRDVRSDACPGAQGRAAAACHRCTGRQEMGAARESPHGAQRGGWRVSVWNIQRQTGASRAALCRHRWIIGRTVRRVSGDAVRAVSCESLGIQLIPGLY